MFEELSIGIGQNPKINEQKLFLLRKSINQKNFEIYSININSLKKYIDDSFNSHFESIKKDFYVSEISQKFGIPLDEVYNIIKTFLVIEIINKKVFNGEGMLIIPYDIEACHYIYKEIFNGGLNLETFKKVFTEMTIKKLNKTYS